MATKHKLAEHIGTMLKNSPELHDLEHDVGFSIYINTFFKRMVSSELLGKEKGVRIQSDDFYNGLVFLDYFCNIIEEDYRARDNLVTISKKLREKENEMSIDKDISYLNLETVIGEVGLCAQDHGPGYYSTEATLKAISERYKNQHMPVDATNAVSADPYYEALGLMICDMVSEDNKKLLLDVSSRIELKAIVFTDFILGHLKNKNGVAEINEALQQKEYIKASVNAIDYLAQEISKEEVYSKIQDYFNERMHDGSKKTHA